VIVGVFVAAGVDVGLVGTVLVADGVELVELGTVVGCCANAIDPERVTATAIDRTGKLRMGRLPGRLDTFAVQAQLSPITIDVSQNLLDYALRPHRTLHKSKEFEIPSSDAAYQVL
jgi:hypothetical protein